MVVYQVKICSKHKNNRLRWLASDISFQLLHTGCPIAHGKITHLSGLKSRIGLEGVCLGTRIVRSILIHDLLAIEIKSLSLKLTIASTSNFSAK